jgi:hypothetical protein
MKIVLRRCYSQPGIGKNPAIRFGAIGGNETNSAGLSHSERSEESGVTGRLFYLWLKFYSSPP